MNSIVLKYVLSKIKGIKNITHIIINSFLLTIVFVCLTIIKFSNDFYYAFNNNMEGRTLLVSIEADNDLLYKNEHIIFSGSDKYRFGYNFFYNNNNYIYIKALVDENYLHIIDGKKIMKSGEMLCSKKLYPYEYSMDMDFSKSIDSKKLLNTKISDESFSFTVVGTYSNKEMEEANICYVSIEDFDKFDIESYGKKMVVYDKKENYDKITKFLNDNEIEYINPNTIDESYTYLKTIPIYIIIIILNIILVITYNFMKKSINNSSKTVGILKAYGESEDNVKRYYIIYQLVIMLISIITSVIIFIGLYYYIQPYLTESIFYNLYVHVPIMYFIIFISIMIIYTYIVISHIINKTNKKDIYDLLK